MNTWFDVTKLVHHMIICSPSKIWWCNTNDWGIILVADTNRFGKEVFICIVNNASEINFFASLSTSCNDLMFTGDYPNYKLGDNNIQYSSSGCSGLCFFGILSCHTFTVITLYVGSRDDFWLWLRIFTYHVRGCCWCITPIFHWLSFLS